MEANPWDAVARAWEEHAAATDEQNAAATDRMLALAGLRAGEHVLELAAGPGGAGLLAAPLVAPGGTVVLSDAAEGMLAVAERRAAAAGLTNVTTRVLDLEDLGGLEGPFDVVLCRHGLMLCSEPERAVRDVVRALAPGGRVVAAVWATREENPWLGTLLDAVSTTIGVEIPPPGLPGPFTLGGAGRLAAVLADAGLEPVADETVDAALRAADADAWWRMVPQLAGPLALVLASLPEEQRDEIAGRAREAARRWQTPDGLVLPGRVVVAAGRR